MILNLLPPSLVMLLIMFALTSFSCSNFLIGVIRIDINRMFASNSSQQPAQQDWQRGKKQNAKKYVLKNVSHDLFQGLVDRFIYLTSEPWKVVDMAMFETPTSFERVVYVRT
jgi:uncharacterized protein (DUF1919 family)